MQLKNLFFDRRDHELIKIVNSVYDADKSLGYTRKLYYPYFHPLGIKELAESKGLRTAYAVVNLLESMERGGIENRLQALQGLKDEILNTADGSMPKNTARVLLEIMKELVRAKGSSARQLRLAHRFRMAAFGKPRITRNLLRHYHLLEMPEEWNQITFDDHVHDANTSGRKSPTHLIMDAWIKGIRRLRVIYYHHIEPRYTAELIEAARIMEIDIRIGIELWARFRGKYISLIWVSRGLPDADAFLCFLAEPHVADFMAQGRAVLKFQEKHILHVLDEFNEKYLDHLNQKFNIIVEPLDKTAFLKFAYPGQPSIPHLAEYIHALAVNAMRKNIKQMKEDNARGDADNQAQLKSLVKEMDTFMPSDIFALYLNPDKYPDIPPPDTAGDQENLPERLKMDFPELVEQVKSLRHDFRMTLKPGNLWPEDVLEIIYMGRGVINRIEIFNMKDYLAGKDAHMLTVNELKNAINSGSSLKLKRIVQQVIQAARGNGHEDIEERLQKLSIILHDLDSLKEMYAVRRIKSRIGSDSTGKSHQAHGMGFGIVSTLSVKAAKALRKNSKDRMMLPIHRSVSREATFLPEEKINPVLSRMIRFFRWVPGIERLSPIQKTQWRLGELKLVEGLRGNIVTLGGVRKQNTNQLAREFETREQKSKLRNWKNFNTRVKNTLKIIAGFIPAFLCFSTTKDWWFLAYFGAFIWFGITGFRVILQSVLGGGGLKRSSLLKWNDYVSWDRLTDALLFTGFSVPLLDYLVKTVLLDRGFGVTVTSNPMLLYSVMALANGIYLSSHNAFRGLPKGMIAGNFFRSVLSIPVAVLLNTVIGGILAFAGIPGINEILQKWAAIISKAASDTVAGLIEGTVDRMYNLDLRYRDINKKLGELFETYTRMELLFPEKEDSRILEKPETLFRHRNSEIRDLSTILIIHALDLFYFWMYLPRARMALLDIVSRMTPEEKMIFLQSQKILEQEQQISRLFVDGILGKNFSRPLSFYLTSYPSYLAALEKRVDRVQGKN